MPTLAELRARKSQPRPRTTATVTLIEGQHLYAEQRALFEEYATLEKREGRTDDDAPAVPRKMDGGRLSEIKARLRVLPNELAEHQGEVTLVGMTGGEWQRWKDEHPPREDNDDDEAFGGRLNSSDLLDDLGRFVSEWAGEPVAADEWDTLLSQSICYGSLCDLVLEVVEMHEVRLPKARPTSSATPSDETA